MIFISSILLSERYSHIKYQILSITYYFLLITPLIIGLLGKVYKLPKKKKNSFNFF